MSSIDKLKALLNKEYNSYKEFHNKNPKDAELDEYINETHGKITPSKVMDKKTLSFFKRKYPKGDYQAYFYDPEMAEKYKAINKLKALLRKEGETNSGEESHKTDHGEEGKTADNYDNREYESEHQHPANPNKIETRKPPAGFYPNFRKFDLDDRDPDDKDIF